MVYTLTVVEEGDEFVASVREFPGLTARGNTHADARRAAMKLALAQEARTLEAAQKTASERAYLERDRARNAGGKTPRNPLKISIEPEAPRDGGASDTNWRGGGWTRGGIISRRDR